MRSFQNHAALGFGVHGYDIPRSVVFTIPVLRATLINGIMQA